MTREQKIEAFTMRIEGCTFREIGNKFGLSAQRVRQVLLASLRPKGEPLIGETNGTHISELKLSNRTYNALRRKGIDTVEKLSDMTADELSGVRNIGNKSLDDLMHKLDELSMSLREAARHE